MRLKRLGPGWYATQDGRVEIDWTPDGWVIAPQEATLVELFDLSGSDLADWQMPVFDTLRQARAWLSEWWITAGHQPTSRSR